MIIQNSPSASEIINKSELKIEEYLLLSHDFNLKSQIIRCKEIDALRPFGTIMNYINKINHKNYRKHIEYDLFQLLDPGSSIKYAFPFFDITGEEEKIEISQANINQHCNFEVQLKGDVPIEWNNEDDQFIINRFRDARNQIDQIKEELRAREKKISELERKVQVRFKIVNFQQVKLGEKIRKIYDYIQTQH